ncbi:MAG: hypothetical protein HC801_12970 [Nitrospira sp.]|nr:hypothetical protein [Nitrospira sp.]
MAYRRGRQILVFYAERDIKIDEEIFIDYHEDYWRSHGAPIRWRIVPTGRIEHGSTMDIERILMPNLIETAVFTREATVNDIPDLIKLNRDAYPTLAEDNIVWSEAHLRSHLSMFAHGQIVAECSGRIVGGMRITGR